MTSGDEKGHRHNFANPFLKVPRSCLVHFLGVFSFIYLIIHLQISTDEIKCETEYLSAKTLCDTVHSQRS